VIILYFKCSSSIGHALLPNEDKIDDIINQLKKQDVSHDYSASYTTDQLIEIALPINQKWEKNAVLKGSDFEEKFFKKLMIFYSENTKSINETTRILHIATNPNVQYSEESNVSHYNSWSNSTIDQYMICYRNKAYFITIVHKKISHDVNDYYKKAELTSMYQIQEAFEKLKNTLNEKKKKDFYRKLGDNDMANLIEKIKQDIDEVNWLEDIGLKDTAKNLYQISGCLLLYNIEINKFTKKFINFTESGESKLNKYVDEKKHLTPLKITGMITAAGISGIYILSDDTNNETPRA
jgi:hypothetical protein